MYSFLFFFLSIPVFFLTVHILGAALKALQVQEKKMKNVKIKDYCVGSFMLCSKECCDLSFFCLFVCFLHAYVRKCAHTQANI